MLILILSVAATPVLVLVIAASLQPDDFRITRSATIAAPPAVVFAQVNDFHNWELWSPWARLDPDSKLTYGGAPSGEGSIYSWDGNSKVGAGRMTLLESNPDHFIKIKLGFFRPFKATHTTEFTFKAAGMQTEVAWSMYGKNNFMAKLRVLIMNCDKMIGGSFEKGLASLDDAARSATPQHA